MKKAYADLPEGQIHYLTAGEGEPLVLLHQTPLSLDEYRDMIPFLAKSNKVIAMDSPGYGKSYRPKRKYEIKDYAQCVMIFLDSLGVKKANVVGSHTGAAIAVEASVTDPEHFEKIILSGCPIYKEGEPQRRLKDPKFQPMEIRADGSHLTQIWQIRREWDPNGQPENWNRAVIDHLMAGSAAEDAHHALWNYPISQRLPLIKHATLLISGTEDVFFNRLEYTKSLIPRCRIQVIEGGGIVIAHSKYKEFAEAVLDFLSKPKV
jgi:pimeloyl-ACP methyl ester carboxylesterase